MFILELIPLSLCPGKQPKQTPSLQNPGETGDQLEKRLVNQILGEEQPPIPPKSKTDNFVPTPTNRLNVIKSKIPHKESR